MKRILLVLAFLCVISLTARAQLNPTDIRLPAKPSPGVSSLKQVRIYFDSTTNKLRYSENGGAYADLGGASLTPGTTVVSGTPGRVLFDDTTLGEDAGFVYDKTADKVTLNHSGIAATAADSLVIANTTAATALVPLQQSPSLRLDGRFWNVSANSAIGARMTLIGYDDEGPIPQLNFDFSNPNVSGGAFTNAATLDSRGKLTVVDLSLTGLTGINLGGSTLLSPASLRVQGGSQVLSSGFNVIGPSVDILDLTFSAGVDRAVLQYYVNGFVLDGTNAGGGTLTNGEFFKGVVPATGFTGSLLKIVDNAGSPATKFEISNAGAITTGTWSATAIADGKVASALTGKTYNGLTVNTTTGTLALTNSKTLTVSNSLTLTATDGSTLAIGGGGTLGTAAYTAASAYLPIGGGTLTGDLLFTDNSFDIGKSGATRPRDIFISRAFTAATAITAGTSIALGSTGSFFFGARAGIYSPADGIFRLANQADDGGFLRLQFGLTTNSYPAISHDAVNGFTLQSAAGTSTWNDPSTANSGTVANRYLFGIAAPTLTATGTSVTDTVASTVYIGGAPAASTNTTIGTAYALNVAAGNVLMGGTLIISSAAPVTLSNAGFTTCTALTTSSNVLTCTVSDRRVKQDFSPFSHGLDFIRRVQPQTYSFKKDSVYYDNGRTRLGLVAQEVDAAGLHDAVLPIGNGLLQIDYPAVTAAAIQAIKELDAKVARLEARIAELEKRH